MRGGNREMKQLFINRKRLAFFFLALLLLFTCGRGVVYAASGKGNELYFTIMHTNDEHSALEGFPLLAAVVKQVRAEKDLVGEPVLVTSGGDFIANNNNLAGLGGWLNMTGFAPELHFMNLIGYDVVCIGNHEFDFGHLGLAGMLSAAGYPVAEKKPVILAANTHPPAGHPLAEPGLLNRTCMVELENGLTIGFTGLIGRDALPPQIFKNGPVQFSDPHDTVREAVQELRQAGADLVVAVIHSRPSYNQELARDVPGIDLILGGHSHKALEPLWEENTLIFQSSSHLQNMGLLELAYDPATGVLRVRNAEGGKPFHIDLDKSVIPDREALDLLDYYNAEADRMINSLTGGQFGGIDDTVASVDFSLTKADSREMTMGNFAADAVRLTAGQRTGQRFDFAMLPSGLYWTDAGPGELTFLDLARIPHFGTGPDMQPGHPLVAFYLTGNEIWRILEMSVLLSELMGSDYFMQVSGARFSYDPRRAILFTLPFPVLNLDVDTPVPSTRAVRSVELYTGQGIQSGSDEDYIRLKRGDRNLYRVVTESYTMYHMPTVGDILPMLRITPKDRHGNPLDYIDEYGQISDCIILHDREGAEIKSWQALVEYAAAQHPGDGVVPLIPAVYAETSGRINQVRAIPLLLYPLILFLSLAAGIVLLIRRRRRRKKALRLGTGP